MWLENLFIIEAIFVIEFFWEMISGAKLPYEPVFHSYFLYNKNYYTIYIYIYIYIFIYTSYESDKFRKQYKILFLSVCLLLLFYFIQLLRCYMDILFLFNKPSLKILLSFYIFLGPGPQFPGGRGRVASHKQF